MKTYLVLVGIAAGATMFGGSAAASGAVAGAASKPTPETTRMVNNFVDRYPAYAADRTSRAPSSLVTSSATDAVLYPTADREVVFVSFQVAGRDHVALVESHGGRITRFTDMAGPRPRHLSITPTDSGDAQAQARLLLTPPPSFARRSSNASQAQRSGAQEQAADILQFASGRMTALASVRIAARAGSHLSEDRLGDSNQSARALLVSSSGR
jgi:hypothetical protein